MIKKTTIALLLTAALALSGATANSQAETAPAMIRAEGKLVRGYTLMPLRIVSEGLGADVTWDQRTRTVTLRRGTIEVELTTQSDYIKVNGVELPIEVRPQIDNGVTFVPLRFISQAIGAKLAWDQATGIATATLDDREVVISTRSMVAAPALTTARMNTLIKKANEAADLSAYSQVRAHFKGYFTDAYINKLVREDGLRTPHAFTVKPYTYFYENEGYGYLSQLEAPDGAGGMFVERKLMVRFIDGAWKVENIILRLISP